MKVLAVDDDPVVLHMLVVLLSKYDHEVSTADDGNVALEKIREELPDIMILDWEMPRVKGIDVCKALSTDSSQMRPYVIMLTARTGKADRMEGFSAGVDDYLTKPLDVEDLIARIRVGERIVRTEKELDRRARGAEERFKKLFDHSPSGVLNTDRGWKIARSDMSEANASLCLLLGRSPETLTGTSFFELVHPSDRPKIERALKSGSWMDLTLDCRLLKENDDHVWTSLNFLDNGDGALIIIEDIDEDKRSQQEILMRTMRYRVEEGKVYLAKRTMRASALEAFKDAIAAGYGGIVLSRSTKKEFDRAVPGEYRFFWIADRGEGSVIPEPGAVLSLIGSCPRHEMILIDGLDHIYNRSGFKEVFGLVSSLRETVFLKDSIAIVTLDETTLQERELASIEKECVPLVPYMKGNLSEDLMEVLKAVYKRDGKHLEATFGTITEDLGLSRPTARKRVNELVCFEYLTDSRRGKRRILSLSEKGRKVFSI